MQVQTQLRDGESSSFWDDAMKYANSAVDVIDTGTVVYNRFAEGDGAGGGPRPPYGESTGPTPGTQGPVNTGGGDPDAPNYLMWGVGGVAVALALYYFLS